MRIRVLAQLSGYNLPGVHDASPVVIVLDRPPRVQPVPHALDVQQAHGAFALARVDQRVGPVVHLVAEAEAAGRDLFVFSDEYLFLKVLVD